MQEEPLIEIPLWQNGEWSTRVYHQREQYVNFVKSCFKRPGQYNFNETSLLFNEQSRNWERDGVYCLHTTGGKDFKRYWEVEKTKCRKGVIFKDGNHEWFLPREYYMWINFLRIYDKIAKLFKFPTVWDVQYHLALYELLAELHYQHAALVKKRQIASSYYHAAKLINEMWFEEGPILKIGASESRHIDMNGTWKYFDEYRDFLNTHTAWYRPMNPGKVMNWQQQIEVVQNGRKKNIGNKGVLLGMSFEGSPTKGVGGPCRYFFYEEAGIAPTMDKTKEYMDSALQMGEISTGMFIAAGSVGELKDCEPLKQMILSPEIGNIYAVETDLMDEKGTIGKSGLFIPEQWGMPPYIDQYGNSKVEEALASLNKTYAEWEKILPPDTYQLRVSQRPRNIAEAFAYREESKFPMNLVSMQKRAIEEKEYPYELIDLSYLPDLSIQIKKTSKPPINKFPINPKMEDKSGSIVVWERPDKGAPWGTYYASVDPVGEGKTTTSESLCTIYVYKNAVQVNRVKADGTIENYMEGDKIVAAWCGRFDDINNTHERLELIIEWYNAWTLVENNVSLFIRHMIGKRKQKYLIRKNEVLFLKEAQANKNVFQDFGWKNIGTLFKGNILSYLLEWLKEVVDQEEDVEGNIIKKFYGIRRIPDMMAMVEMEAYRDGVNVDRLIALGALIAFVKIQQTNRGITTRQENELEDNLHKSENLYKLKSSPFTNIGKGKAQDSLYKKSRSITKRLR